MRQDRFGIPLNSNSRGSYYEVKEMNKDENKVFRVAHNKSITRIFLGGEIQKCAETPIMVYLNIGKYIG